MDSDFWLQRWQENNIGFHQDQVHPYLLRFWPRLTETAGKHVLVPLCGKSVDMDWFLHQQLQVTGVELSEIAIKDYWQARQLDIKGESVASFKRYQWQELTLLEGDLFKLTPEQLPSIDFIYDRAALVAMPPTLQEPYAETLTRLSAPGCKQFLIGFEYQAEKKVGPPFSVDRQQIEFLYQADWHIELLISEPVEERYPGLVKSGRSQLVESVWLLTRF